MEILIGVLKLYSFPFGYLIYQFLYLRELSMWFYADIQGSRCVGFDRGNPIFDQNLPPQEKPTYTGIKTGFKNWMGVS